MVKALALILVVSLVAFEGESKAAEVSAANQTLFIQKLLPIVQDVNKQIELDRQRILTIQKSYQAGDNLTPADKAFINARVEEVRVNYFSLKKTESWNELLYKFDQIPTSMTIAQAAHESAYGTSRFAKEGNNLFGVWCFKPGCGLVPKQRKAGATHEVAVYKNRRQAVHGYMMNLNKRGPFDSVRQIRAKLKGSKQKVTGVALSDGLDKYSAGGKSYNAIIRKKIKELNLAKYD